MCKLGAGTGGRCSKLYLYARCLTQAERVGSFCKLYVIVIAIAVAAAFCYGGFTLRE